MAKCECCGQNFFTIVIHPIVKDFFGMEHKICMDCYRRGNTPGKAVFYDFGEKKVVIKDRVEYRKRCKVCGKVFCYTTDDLKRNFDLAEQAKRQSVTGVVSALAGATAASAINTGNAENNLSRIIDYGKCPSCGSTELEDISKEEYTTAKRNETQRATQNATTGNAVSTADEIKKFKELLDNGVISQEEFDAKKKQLLGL